MPQTQAEVARVTNGVKLDTITDHDKLCQVIRAESAQSKIEIKCAAVHTISARHLAQWLSVAAGSCV